MPYEYELASELKRMSGRKGAPLVHIATVVQSSPLTFALYDGELLAPPLSMTLSATARAGKWEQGDSALALFEGGAVYIIDKV